MKHKRDRLCFTQLFVPQASQSSWDRRGEMDVRLAIPSAQSDCGMENFMDIQVGDVVTLKKQHPCGSREWEVLRIGADFRLKCAGCGHQIMIARRLVEKNLRDIKRKA